MKLRALLSSLVILAAFTGAYCYGVSIPDGELGPGHVLTVIAIAAVTVGAIRVIGWTRCRHRWSPWYREWLTDEEIRLCERCGAHQRRDA